MYTSVIRCVGATRRSDRRRNRLCCHRLLLVVAACECDGDHCGTIHSRSFLFIFHTTFNTDIRHPLLDLTRHFPILPVSRTNLLADMKCSISFNQTNDFLETMNVRVRPMTIIPLLTIAAVTSLEESTWFLMQ